jgi:glucokinase
VTGPSTFLGLDVGGTYLKGARLSGSGALLARLHEPIRKESPQSLLGQLTEAVQKLECDGSAAGLGLGLPGIVDLRTGRLRNAPNVPVLNGVDLSRELESRTGRPAFLENDANAAALAEAWLGAGRGAETLLYVTLGTGVGGALVFQGRVWAGRGGFAGEIGHLQVDPAGLPCGCGSWGCVETIVGIAGWVRRAREASSRRRSALSLHPQLTPEVIVNEARAGDAVALEVVDGAAQALAVALAGTLNLVNVERVVIGGGVAQAGDFLLDRVVAETRRRTFAHVFEDATFRLAELGGDAGAMGAARVGMIGVQAA